MDPTTILLAALAVAGYFFFRDDKKKKGDHDARHGWHGRHGGDGGSDDGAPEARLPTTPAGPGPLLDLMDQMIGHAIAQKDADAAVAALKLAGTLGVSQVGPAIDRATGGQSATLTTAAAHDNAALQASRSSKAGLSWALTMAGPVIGPFLAPLAAYQTYAVTRATEADKQRAIGLARGMYEKYTSAMQLVPVAVALPSAVAGYGYVTGIGTVIPSQYRAAHPACGDAAVDPHVCATVAAALANEGDPSKLRVLATSVAGAGFRAAANMLLVKADALG